MTDKKEEKVSKKYKPLEKTGAKLVCHQCGKSFLVFPHRKDTAKYCSNKCYREWLKDNPPQGHKFKKGHITWNKNIKIDRDKYPTMGHFQKHIAKTKKKMSKSWKYENHVTDEMRKNLSKSMKGYTKTKEHIRNNLKRRKMSMLEVTVNDVIKKYSLPYKFVGNGEVLIGRKNPDFVNINGEKTAVEVYCKRHKDYFRGGCEGWKKDRSKLFSEYGWKIIFIEDWQTNKESAIYNLLI